MLECANHIELNTHSLITSKKQEGKDVLKILWHYEFF